jgi:hypothetical protein
MAVKHKKNLAGASNGNTNQVQPGDWNDNHDLTGVLALLDVLSPVPDRVLTIGADGTAQLIPKSTWLLALNAVLTGTPTAPTAVTGTNTQQIATTAFVKNAVDALIAAAPGALNTLDELAAALGDDANYAATITAALALKAPLASPAFTGNPTVPNQSAGTNNTRAANTAYADAAVAALSALIVAGGTAVPGAVIGSVLASYTTNAVLTGTIPLDDTVPLNTEGDLILTQAYTPKSTTNKLRITARGVLATTPADNLVAAIFAGSTCLQAAMINVTGANTKHAFMLQAEYTPGSVTSQSITLRTGGPGASYSHNGSTIGRVLGGAQATTLLIEEIKA